MPTETWSTRRLQVSTVLTLWLLVIIIHVPKHGEKLTVQVTLVVPLVTSATLSNTSTPKELCKPSPERVVTSVVLTTRVLVWKLLMLHRLPASVLRTKAISG
jgi:hypothetical protein